MGWKFIWNIVIERDSAYTPGQKRSLLGNIAIGLAVLGVTAAVIWEIVQTFR